MTSDNDDDSDSDEMFDDVMTDAQFAQIFDEDSDTEFEGF
jgi:hypothetical protein